MKLIDKLHKAALYTLMGFSALGVVTFTAQFVQYFTVIRPQRLQNTSKSTGTSSNMFEKMNVFLRSVKSFVLFRSVSSLNAESKRTWNILRINHVALATGSLEKSVTLFRDILGIKTSESIPVPDHGVSTVFVELSNTKLELLVPFGEKSPIAKFLEKNKAGGMHHLCLEVDNINNAVKDLRENNIGLLSDKPKIGAHGKPVIFLHPKDCGGVLIELEEV